jgi:hypothetical protein
VVVAKVRARFRRTSLLFRTAIATPTPKTALLSGLDIKTSARAGKKRISYVFLTDFFNFFFGRKMGKVVAKLIPTASKRHLHWQSLPTKCLTKYSEK